MVIGFHGRWQYKQFNASKQSKYHIKTFGLCDSQTGYVYNIFTYYGSQTAYHPDLNPKCSQAIKVFEKLLRPLQKGHHIFAYKFYTSMPLLRYLRSKGFHYTGTVDTRRKISLLISRPLNLIFFKSSGMPHKTTGFFSLHLETKKPKRMWWSQQRMVKLEQEK